MIRSLKVGDKAPDFTLKNQDGKDVKLSKYQGLFGKPVVLYFYPSDDSPGCTKQAKAFKQSISDFKKAGAEVLGISGQDVESHVAFKSKLDLPFPLLADEGDAVRKAYGVKKDLLGLLDGRETYVIGKDGLIKLVYNNQFDSESHVDKALEALSA
jgi:peroxiredoxin Q/BCP